MLSNLSDENSLVRILVSKTSICTARFFLSRESPILVGRICTTEGIFYLPQQSHP